MERELIAQYEARIDELLPRLARREPGRWPREIARAAADDARLWPRQDRQRRARSCPRGRVAAPLRSAALSTAAGRAAGRADCVASPSSRADRSCHDAAMARRWAALVVEPARRRPPLLATHARTIQTRCIRTLSPPAPGVAACRGGWCYLLLGAPPASSGVILVQERMLAAAPVGQRVATLRGRWRRPSAIAIARVLT